MLGITLTNRLYETIRQTSIRTIYEAAVEILTNSDDAYRNAGTQIKDMRIYVERGDMTTVSFVDQATGMTSQEMKDRLLTIGSYTAGLESRGMMGRGAKDCSFLGDVTFTCIKSGNLSQLILYQDTSVKVTFEDIPVTQDDRSKYDINVNGTNVSLKVPNSTVPDIETFYESLSRNIFLRRMLREFGTNIVVRENALSFVKTLSYSLPPGKLIVSCDYDVIGYNTKAHLELYRADEEIPFPAKPDQTQYGVIVQSDRAIYECCALYYASPGIKDYMWDQNIRYIYGTLTCPLIETIARQAIDGNVGDLNPYLVIDPNRRAGLSREHPFTAALFKSGYQLIDIAINRIQDTRDDRLLDNGNASDVLNSLNDMISSLLPPEDALYTWRTKSDTQNLMNLASSIKNVKLDSDFLGLTWDQIQQLSKDKVLQIQTPSSSSSNFKIGFTSDPKLKNPYQILYLPGQISMKINVNDPSVSQFISVQQDSVNLINVGKALTSIGAHTTEATNDLILRRSIISGQTSNLDMNSFNEYSFHYNSIRGDVAPRVFSTILSGIESAKSETNPVPLS